MRAYTFMLLLPGVLSAASPRDCTTRLGVPCMIVESVREQWSVLTTGINYHHSKTYHKTAYGSTGSIAHEVTFEKIPLIGTAEVAGRGAELYLWPSDRVVRIFHSDRKFSSREPMIWHDRPYRRAKDGDKTCASGILHSGTDFQETGEHTILGMKTFRWYRPLEYGGYEEQFLAPALDCLALRSVLVQRNVLRFPVFTNRSEVISIKFGEPDRALFDIPAGYQEVPDPSAERLRRFVEANQGRASVPPR
jgi:hypothetical protein